MRERIRAIRQHNGMTQKEFGESLGVSRDTYASYESGRVEPSKTFIQLLCSSYDVNDQWIITGFGEMFIQTKQSTIDKLTAEYGLSTYFRKLMECYLDLDNDKREVVDGLLATYAESINADKELAPIRVVDAIDAYRQERDDNKAEISQPLTIEQEAEAYALKVSEEARRQFLNEKNRELLESSVNESGAV